MIALVLLLQAASPSPAGTQPADQADRIEQTVDITTNLIAGRAGLSNAGIEEFRRHQREHASSVWLSPQPDASDIAREELLDVLATDPVDEARISEARRLSDEAAFHDNRASDDGLIEMMRRLSADDRRRLASYLAEDSRAARQKRMRLRR